jgi:hypothetical protein
MTDRFGAVNADLAMLSHCVLLRRPHRRAGVRLGTTTHAT